jgi:hypothetical protein
LSTINIGQAWLGFSSKPADKLSPTTRIRFTLEEPWFAASNDCAVVKANNTIPMAARVRHCFPDLCIYFAALTFAGKPWSATPDRQFERNFVHG